MKIKLDGILSKLTGYKMKVYTNSNLDLSYDKVRYLYKDEIKTNLKEDTLYIGRASVISNETAILKDIGLFLIEDCPIDPSQFEAEIVLLSAETNLFKLFNDIMDIFTSNRKLVDSSAALLNSLIKGKGLNYIVQVGSEILGNPVFLVDAASKLLAASSNTNVDDVFWNDLANLGYGIDENLTPYVQTGYADKVAQSARPLMLDSVSPKNLKRIVGKIQVKGRLIGYIAVLENNQKLKEEDIILTELLCDVIASEMQKSKIYNDLAGVKHEFLLMDLLNNRIENEELVRERSMGLFHSPIKNLYVAAINLYEGGRNARFPGYLRWTCEKLLPECKSVYFNDHIVLLFNSRSKAQWEETKEKLTEILKKYNISSGLSLIFHDILDTKRHFLQAEKGFRLGQLLNRKELLFNYEDLYIYDLLSCLKKDINADNFTHPNIVNLIRYDKSNGTDYYNTLLEYLLCAGNITKTAGKLFLHRNTVVHRVNRIQEILDMNLEDGDNRFKLLLTYKIKEMQ